MRQAANKINNLYYMELYFVMQIPVMRSVRQQMISITSFTWNYTL